MTRVVWKYELDIIDDQQVRPMPDGAKIVHAHGQEGVVCVWAEVNPVNSLVNRTFVIRGTGQEFHNDASTYIGTAHTHGGSLVWHVYEEMTR